MLNIKKIASALVIVAWIGMMGLLVKKTLVVPTKPVTHQKSAGTEIEAGEEWAGIYFKEKKAGYTFSRREITAAGYHFAEEAVMDLSMLDVPQRITTAINADTDKNLVLRSFNFKIQAGIISFSASGEVSGTTVHMKLSTGGTVQETKIALEEAPCLEGSLRFVMAREGLSSGKKIARTVFDPFTMSNRKIIAQVEGPEVVIIKGKKYPCVRIKESFSGITVYSWIDENGETVKEESPMGFTLVKESKEAATAGSTGKPPDIIAATGIPVNRPVDKERMAHLRVRLENVALDGFVLHGGRQSRHNDILDIQLETIQDTQTFIVPFRQAGFQEYLSASPFIQSDSIGVTGQMKTIIGNERDAQKIVKKLLEWVYVHIEKIPTFSIPSAVEVLRTMRGDCNEHAVLFAALCRAAGIPAKTCAGIVYVNGKFYYHAWVEVYLNAWVTVDPALNQFPADVTHIKFVEGEIDRQLELVRIVGKLSIEVLECS